MEKWEKDLRSRLNKELSDGLYKIGIPGSVHCYTSKQGKIDFEVAMQHELRKINSEFSQNDLEITKNSITFVEQNGTNS